MGMVHDDQVCAGIGGLLVYCSCEAELSFAGSGFPEESFDLVVLDRADEAVQSVCLGGSGGDGGHFMVLSQKDGKGEADIADACNCDFHWVIPFFLFIYNRSCLTASGSVRKALS